MGESVIGEGFSFPLLCFLGYAEPLLGVISGCTLPPLPDGGQVQTPVIVPSNRCLMME